MRNTLQLIGHIPRYETGGTPMPECEWLELSRKVHRQAVEDVQEIVKAAQQLCPLPLLQQIQYDHIIWAKPSHLLGTVRIVGDDDYLMKTQGQSLDAARQNCRGSYTLHGVELKFELFRPIHFPEKQPPFDTVDYGLRTSFEINGTPEFIAFREIYRDWRGILRKMLESTPIEFSMNAGIPIVERIRSRQPLPKLDAVMTLNPEEQETTFELEFNWNPLPRETGISTFLPLAVLFTCVQKATIAPRSKREHFLQYWLAISQSNSNPTKPNLQPKETPLPSTGPTFLKSATPDQIDPNIKPLGISMEYSVGSNSHRVPLYGRILPFQNGQISFQEIVMKEEDLPCETLAPGHLIASTAQGSFFPLDSVLFALYRHGLTTRPLRTVLTECRELISFRDGFFADKETYRNLIHPELAEKGYAVTFTDSTGREIEVGFGWIPPQDITEANSRPAISCARVGYRIQSDGGMGNGRWYKCGDGVGKLLGEEMRQLRPGSLKNLLADNVEQILLAGRKG